MQLGPRRIGYGLPCVKCKTYYAADLSACPVCKSEERVLPTVALSGAAVKELIEPPSGVLPDDAALEEERERFLREFNAQVYASDAQINVVVFDAVLTSITRAIRSRPPCAKAATCACKSEWTCWRPRCTWT